MGALPLWLLVLIFVAAGAVVWVAGIQLSKDTDVLDARLHIGSAVGGPAAAPFDSAPIDTTALLADTDLAPGR